MGVDLHPMQMPLFAFICLSKTHNCQGRSRQSTMGRARYSLGSDNTSLESECPRKIGSFRAAATLTPASATDERSL